MSSNTQTLSVQKRSQLGALHQLHEAPGKLRRDDPLGGVTLYLRTLKESGRRTQRVKLEMAARILTGDGDASLLDYNWRALRRGHVEFVRSVLAQTYAPSVVNACLSALKGVAEWMMHLGQIEEAEEQRIRRVKGVRADRRARSGRSLSGSEIVALFQSCERDRARLIGLRDAALLTVIYVGGLRCRETCSLKLADYSPRRHQLFVEDGKGNRERRAYLRDGGARRAMNAWLRARGEGEGALILPVTKNNQVVMRPLSRDGLYKALQRRAVAAGVDRFSIHDLRRSCGSHLVAKGADLDTVRDYLGHVDINTTIVYIRHEERKKQEASLKLKVNFGGRRRGRKRRKRRR